LPALDDARCIAQLERKIGQLTMENGFLKKVKNHLTHPRHTGTIDIFEGFVSDPLNPPKVDERRGTKGDKRGDETAMGGVSKGAGKVGASPHWP
jgi:hypothetical protein